MGAQAGRAVIFSARGYCCAGRTRQRMAERSATIADVKNFLQLAFTANPEIRFSAAAETGGGLVLSPERLLP